MVVVGAFRFLFNGHTFPVAARFTFAAIVVAVTLVFHRFTHAIVALIGAPTIVVVAALGFFDRSTRKRDALFIWTAILIFITLKTCISAFAVVTLLPRITDVASTGGTTFAVVTGLFGTTLRIVSTPRDAGEAIVTDLASTALLIVTAASIV